MQICLASPLMGEDKGEGKKPPHSNSLPPGERKKEAILRPDKSGLAMTMREKPRNPNVKQSSKSQ